MERQNRLLTVLSLALLALVAIVVLDKSPEKSTDPDAPPERAAFEDLQGNDVRGLTLTRAGERLRFEKREDGWFLTEPRELRVDDRKVQEVVDRLAGLRLEERQLSAAREGYGLDEASRVGVDLARGDGTSVHMWVGRDAPLGYDCYVAETADGPVLLGKTQLRSLVTRAVDDFRDRKAWRVSSGTATRVELQDGRSGEVQRVELRKDARGWWLGDGVRADEEALVEWLGRAALVSAASFGTPEQVEAVGLAQPRASLTVEDADGIHVLRYGQEAEGTVWVQGEGDPMRVDPEALTLLRTDGWALRSALPVRRAMLDRLELTLGEKSAALEKKDGTWRRSDGGTVPDIDRLFDAVAAIAADRSSPGKAPSPAWGKLTLGEGATKRTLDLGPEVDGWHAATEAEGGAPFRVSASTLRAAFEALSGS